MSITQYEGPLVVGGRGVVVDGYRPDFNADAGPSSVPLGWGINDPRWQYQDGPSANRMIQWFGDSYCPVLDITPGTASTTVLAAAQAAVSGTALTLNTTSGGGALTILTSALTVYPSRTLVPSGTVAIDGAPGLLAFGQTGAIASYDPSKASSRVLTVTFAGADAAGFVTLAGYDTYGYAMTEHIAGASGTATQGKKAFKFLVSATPGGTLTGSNISVGTTNLVGLPMYATEFGFIKTVFANVLGTSGGFVSADATSPATSATGDVRGTYNPGTLNGSSKLQVFITPNPILLQSLGGVALVGVTQV